MASFPDLRPVSRSAKAGSKAVRRARLSVLLAASTALLLTAFFAVSELATLRGAKAHDASAYLTRELGSPLSSAPLVRAPAHGVKVSIRKHGYQVDAGAAQLSLISSVKGGAWRSYEHGTRRPNAVGSETILVDGDSAEEFLTVTRHQGRRTWRWRLDTKLEPRLTPAGFVGFFAGNRLSRLGIEPVTILDAEGHDVTPHGARWTTVRRGGQTLLELTLDDSKLATPYTIDPTISFRAAGTVGTSASGTSISVGIPAGAVVQDLLLLQVDVASTTIPSTPTGWTLVSQTNTANSAVAQAVFWRKAISGDPGGSVAVTIPNAAAVGVVTAYKGVDTQAASPIQQTAASQTQNNKNVTCPGLTTSAANEMVVCAGTIAVNGTWPASGGGFTRRATGAQGTSVSLGWYDQFVATSGTVIAATNFSNVAAANTRSIANNFGLVVDTTAPLNGTVGIANVSPAGIAYQSGSTIYYRGSAAGQFQLADPFTDAKSAPGSVNYPLLTSTGWTHANETVTTAPDFQSANYQWSAGTTTPPTVAERTLTESDAAGNTATQAVSIVNDTTAPSVTAPTVTAGYYTSLSVGVTLNGGSDGGSGVASGSSVAQREEATLSGGSCGSFPGTWTNVTLTAGNDTSVQNGKCYQYREQLTDNVGNVGSSSASNIAKVDNAGPTNALSLTSVSPAGSAVKSGTTVYYRGVEPGGGSVKIRNTVSDGESGPASSQTAALGGTTSGWTHTPSTVSTPSGGPYDSNDFTWAQATSSSPTELVTGRDGAGNATAASILTLTNDSTAPTGGALTVNGGSAYDSDGNFAIDSRTDYSETQSTTESGLASSTLVRTSASFSSADVCGSFGSPTTLVGTPAQNGLSTGCYRYTLTGTDNVGNTVSVSTTIKVDTSNPSAPTLTPSNATGGAYYQGSGTRVYFKPDAANGGFDLAASSTDDDTGIASYTFPAGSAIGTNWSASGSGSSRTYSYTATATTNGSQNVTATNNAGRASSSSSFDVTLDSTAPTGGALTVNGGAAYDTDGNFPIDSRTDYTETQSATQSGLAASTLVRTSASFTSADVCGAFGSPTTLVGTPAQSGLATGCYKYTLSGTDNVGNTVSISSTIKVDTSDPSAPTFTVAAVGGGAYYPGGGTRVYFKPDAATGTFDITASATDAHTGIASYTFPAGSALGTNWSGSGSGAARTYSYTATATTNGSQSVSATNYAGRSNSSSLDLTADSTAPTGGALTVNGGAGYDADGNFAIDSRTDYSETQSATESGLASSTLVRTSASFTSPDVCGSFGSPTTLVGTPAQSGLSTGCYRYTLTGTDNVGNSVSVSTTVKVDTSDPSAPSLSFSGVGGGAYYPGSGTRVYFKPDASNGTFDVSASSSDSDTGIASYGFPSGASVGTNWSASGSGSSRTYSYTATATSNGSQSVSANNNAGRSASSTFDPTADSSAPTGGALTVNGGSSYDSDGSFPIDTRTDYDEAQSATQSGLASSTLVRTSASFASTDVCGSFGSPTTITGNPDQTGLSTGCYRYTLTGTDNVGNTVSIFTTVKVDTSDPSAPALSLSNATGGAYYPGSGTRVYFKPDAASGGFDIGASSSDNDTGIASYTFPTGAALGTTWSASGGGSSRTYSYTAPATSNGSQSVSAANNAGRSASSSFDPVADSTAPTGGALTVNGGSTYSSSGNFPIDTRTDYSETQSATASGLASSMLVRTSASYSSADVCGSFGSPATISGNPDQTGLSTGCYRYTLTGTDSVGNAVSISTTVKVDTSDPSAPTFTFSNFTGTTTSVGNVVFFLPTGSGSFDITASSTDNDTGIGSYTFPSAASFGSGWSVSGSGATRTYSYVAGAVTPGSQPVTATNNAGRTASANFSVVVSDTTAPTTTIQCNAAACQGTYYTSAPVSVTLSADDGVGGAGVDVIRYTLDGSDPTPVNGSDYVSALDVSTTTSIKFRAYDNLGNEEAVGTQLVQVDGTPPSVSLALSEQPASAAQHVSGQTLYYRPGAAGGTFRVSATVDDPETGIDSVDFPAIANVTGGGTQTSAPYREDYTWSASTTDATSHNVVATNGAGATGSASFTLTQDSTAPSGQSISLTGADAPYYGSASVTFTLGDGSDGGSGLDTGSRTVTRETGTLSGDSCSGFAADGGTYSSPDTSVSGGHCYRYTFRISDNVGNASSAVTATAKVDTQAPSISFDAPTELSGGGSQYYDAGPKTLFFRSTSSGSFRLNSTSSDTHTAVTGVTYPDLSGVSGWSTGGTDSSWSSGATAPGARNVTATDKASNSGSDTITIADDTSAPTGQAITLTGATAPYFNTVSVTFSLNDGNDGSGSGIDTSTRTVTRETGTLSGDSCSGFTADDGTFTSPDSSVSGGHCYRYTFTIADRVGNVSSAVTATAKVDTNAPSISVDAPVELTAPGNQYYDAGSQTHFFRPGGSGSFALNATAADGESAIDHVAFPDVSAVGGWTGSTGGSDSSSPYSSPVDYAWSSGAGAPGLRSITATNGAAIDGSAGITLAADSSAPTGQTINLTGASVPYYGSASVSFTLGDGSDSSGAGLDTSTRTVTRETGTLSGDSCSGFTADGGTFTSPDTSVSGGHCYRYRFTIADRVGNVSAGATAVAKVDTAGPSVSLTDPGTAVNGTVPLSATATDAHTSVAQVAFEWSPAGAGSWTAISTDATAPYTANWDTSGLSDGLYDLRAVATDTLNNFGSDVVANRSVDHTPPDTTIDSSPPAQDNDTTPTFTFSSSESGSTFECRVDGGSFAPCTSPHTISPALAEGSHTFDVRATDAAGNTDSSPASYTWSIDLGPPTVTITAPTTYINSSDPGTYSVTASTPDGDVTRVDFYECSNASANCGTGTWTQFDTDASAPYSGSWSTPGSDGTRAIRAVAVDVASNTGAHIRNITIDRTAPTNVTVSYPNNYIFGSFAISTSNGSDPDVDASSSVLQRQIGDLASDSCSGYGGWTTATSPDTVASGKCAKYRCRVADNAGNWTTATNSNEVKSDAAEPSSSQSDPGTNLRQTVGLTASASDTGGSGLASVAFQRRPTGGGSWTTIATDTSSPYATSFDTTTVSDGLYDFRAVATDIAGNVESAPTVVANRRIDNTAPSATMLSPGNPIRGTVSLTSNTSDAGSGIDTVSYQLAPSGGSFNSQTASWDTTLNSDGLYDLRVVATDLAGNSTTSSLITTRVDNTAPALTFSSPASGATVSGSTNLVASASDASPASPPVAFAYKLYSDPASAYTATGSSWNTNALPGGDDLYDLRARATDDAGNTTTVENTSIRVDNAPPTISITAPAAAINGSVPTPTSFSATALDVGGSGVAQVQFFECSDQSLNCSTGIWSPLGTVAAPGPYSVSWNIPAVDGNHALAAVATDNAGHPATAIRNVDVDRSAPNTTFTGKPADPSNAVTPTFTFSSTESGSTFECRVDGGSFGSCTSPHDLTGLTDNDHTFEVRATDAAGNTDPSPDSWTWHRDTSAPTGTLNNPGANVRQVVTLTSVESDPPADGYASGLASVSYEYSSDGSSWALIGTNNSAPFDSFLWTTTSVLDGVYQLRIVVRDVAGNVTNSSAVTNVRVDNTPPTTSQNDPGQYLRATKTLTGSAADSGSGVDHVDFQRAPTGGGSWTTIATDSTPGDGFQADFDTTSVADGHYDFRTVAFDVAGNQAAASPVTDRLVDNTLPDATINSPGAYLRGAVSLTSSTSDPGGTNASGVVSVAYEFSTNGGSTWQSTGSTFDSTAVADGNVDLHVVATDAAGNPRTSAAVTSLVDNTKPATTDNAPAGWQSSPVTVTLTANDGGSGVNVTEYSVDGSPTYTVGTSVVIPAPADGSNDGAHTIAYFSVDNAGNIETVKSTTVLIDATPPACPSCSAGDYLRGTVTLTASPDAGGSGIQSAAFEYTTAGGSIWTTIGTDSTSPYSVDWDTTPVADGHYDLRISITDNAGNVTTSNLPDKAVDNTAPDTASVGAPTEGQVVTGTISIAASASDATSPIDYVRFYVRGSLLGTDSTAPYAMNWDTTTGPDGGATIQVVVADMAGNTATSALRNGSVDNVSPAPALADPGQNLSGTVSLSASSDADTTQVDFERRPAGGGAWITIASDTTLPWGTSLDTTTLADGLYDFRAVATDASGHTGASPIRSNIRVDNTSPSGSLTAPAAGATVGGSNVQLSVSVSDSGSGVASVRYELRPTGGGSFNTIATSSSSPFGATWDATTVSTGSYDLRPVITDQAGNSFTGGAVTFNVDVTAPTVTLTNPGASISGLVTLNATVSGSGAAQVAFGATPSGGSSWSSLGTDSSSPWSIQYDTTKLADGVYDLRATVTDTLGNTSSDVITGVQVDNTAPRVVSSTPGEGSTVTSASSIALATSEAATPVGVTLDGSSTVPPVLAGTNITYNTGSLAAGPHTLAGELQDSAGKRSPFRVHFTVGSGYVERNTSSSSSTTVVSSDGFAAATMPAGAWSSGSDWIVLRITPTAAPSGLTNGFGAGPEATDVTAWWALAGTQVHQFSAPIDIVMHSVEKGLVPATFENGAWRIIHRVPTAGSLPAGWDDGFYADGAGFHVLTKHLSLFALLRDLEPPRPPQSIRGYIGPSGLTIRWLPGSDNSGTYDFVTLFAGSVDAGHYDTDYTAATVADWKPGDPRIFRLRETDLAGNESELSQPLLPVPSLAGLTPDEAEAALKAHGFTIGSISVGGTGKPGTVTGPEGLVLAEQGSTIDLVVAPGGRATSLVFKVVTAPKVRPGAASKLAARISLTRAARVTGVLYSPRKVKLFTWRFSLKAGRTIVKLKVPRQVQRTGVYTIRWTARAGRENASRTIKIRIAGLRTKPLQPIRVLLAGPAARDVKLGKNPQVVRAASVEPTFDAAASRRNDVRVIVVDVDAFGVTLVRELHMVFPTVKIVALAAGPRTMALALKAGATVVLPRSTPPATLAKVINRLLKKR